MSPGRVVRIAGLMAVAIGLVSERASADAAALLKRLPAGANVIAYVDVESLLNSKLGVKEGWREKLKDAYASKPLIVPPSAKHVMMASWLEPNGMNPVWEVSVMELATTISLERIAKDEKGFTESFGDKLAAWTPMNAYFVRLDSKLLGVVCPSDRQFAARWAGHTGSGADAASPFLRAAVSQMEPKTDYLFAMDLGDMVSEKRCRGRLSMDEFECLAGKEIDVKKISGIIASVKGLKLVVRVGDDISGDCVVEFGQPVAELGAFAKPLLLEMLDRSGAGIPDFNDWKDAAKGSTVHLTGKLSADGFRRLLSVVDPPSPLNTDEESSAEPSSPGKTPAAPSQDAVAKASVKYFKSVADIIDGVGKSARGATSMNKGATYIARDARRISRLPILNVDPDLVQWGTDVSNRLLQVASSLGGGGFTAQAGTANVMEQSVNTWDYDYDYGERRIDPNDEINRRNASRQRAAATAQAKAGVLKDVTQVLQDIEASRGAIRAAMTQKLKAEF